MIPIIWIVLASFSSGNSLYSEGGTLTKPSLIHYKELLSTTNFGLWYFNTFKIATINMILSVFLSMGSAYVFSRFRFKGRKLALSTTMIMQLFPSIMGMIAIYLLLQMIGLLDTHMGLILVYAGGQIPFNTWLVKGYLDSIPRSLDEAAKMDGARNITIFSKVIIPIAKPIITYLALTNFIAPWMDFMLPQLVLRSPHKKTLAIALYSMVAGQQNTEFTSFAAGAVMVALPITLLFVYLQKYIVVGLSSGASKS
jgi:arabinogalactan oligomer/maltooligosaccharide transport system permease protein